MAGDATLERRLRGQDVAALALNFGPYHLGRLRAVAAALRDYDARLTAIELARVEVDRPWRVSASEEPFRWLTLFNDRPVEAVPARLQRRSVTRALDEIGPRAVVIPGWSHPFLRAALTWCGRRPVSAVVVSDSTANTRRRGSQVVSRPWYLELYKRWILRGFGAAFVSGNRARQYLAGLGMPNERIFLKCDVVDNEFFERVASETRADVARYRQQYGLPERFFLTPGRVLALKNHVRLLESHGRYLSGAGRQPWGLIILGSGPAEADVDAKVAELGSAIVQRRPFAQIEEVARYYGLASALVLPSWSETWGLVVNEAAAARLPLLVSRECPAADHLVIEGENGWTFDPLDVDAIAACLTRLASLPHSELSRMGQASGRIVADWSLEAHARELLKAIAAGFNRRDRRAHDDADHSQDGAERCV